jgi:hypothetical protein
MPINFSDLGDNTSTTTSNFLVQSNLDFFEINLGSGLFILTTTPDSGSFASPQIVFYDTSNNVLATFNANSATYYSASTVSKIRFTHTSTSTGRASLTYGSVFAKSIASIRATRSFTLLKTATAYCFGGGGGAGGATPDATVGGSGGGSGYQASGVIEPGTYTATIGGGGARGYYGNGPSGFATSFSTVSANGGSGGTGGTISSSPGGAGGSGGGAGGNGTFGLGGVNGANGGAVGGVLGGTGSGVAIPTFTGNYPASLIFPTSARASDNAAGAGAFYAGGNGARADNTNGVAAAVNTAGGGGGGWAAWGQGQEGGPGGSGIIYLVEQ